MLLKRYDIPTRGAEVVIVGRSQLVGRPLALLLSLKGTDATVTICHTGTRDLAAVTRRADIVVVAAGRIDTLTGAMVKPGAAVLDVGINRDTEGKLVGDVDFASVAEVARWITPVPGGIGPMTRALLLHNTVVAARAQHGLA